MPARGSSWGDPRVIRWFATHGCTDPGEAAALASVEPWSRGRILDIGVGGGRTTGLLAATAAGYVGIDIEPEMVTLARRRFPDSEFRVLDGRDVGGIDDVPAGGFDLVLWSFNGLDALAHTDRGRALAGMAAVTAPEGRVLFSSLNLDGVSFDERPWTLPQPTGRRARLHLAVMVRHPSVLSHGIRNYRRTRAKSVDGDGWAMRPMRAHEFRFVVHFATLAETVAEAAAAGLVVVSAWTDTGEPVDLSAEHVAADYVHYVCRRA